MKKCDWDVEDVVKVDRCYNTLGGPKKMHAML